MDELIKDFVKRSLDEDVQTGDHTTIATIEKDAIGQAYLEAKESGVIAGIDVVRDLFHAYDESLEYEPLLEDGAHVEAGEVVFKVSGTYRSILTMERTVLNTLQRMSAIATITNQYVKSIQHTKAKILDTRKTTPGFRWFEKLAVRIGGGGNHRFGLYDMILIKDNHIDAAGGIDQVLNRVDAYLKQNELSLDIEIETRSVSEVEQVIQNGKCDRIMLDNFTPSMTKEAVTLVGRRFELESSGGITLATVRDYAETGVDYISVGALTHSIKAFDMSLKIKAN